MNLANYSAIGSALLIRIAVPDEAVTTFSTYWKSLTVDGTTYTGLGSLVSLSETQNNIRATGQELTISISGIPAENLTLAKQTLLRGSTVQVRRYVFDPNTGSALAIADNPTGRFFGIITNFAIDFTANIAEADRSGTAVISLTCASTVSQLGNKVSGRRTAKEDQKRYYPGDLSMDRIGCLCRSNFNFGGPA